MAHPVFDTFVAPARARPQLWRLAAGLLVAGVVYVLWVAAVIGAAWWASGEPFDGGWLQRLAQPDRPVPMLVLLATFGGMLAGPVVAARLVHRRGGGSLFGPAVRVLRHFVRAAAAIGAVLTLALLAWSLLYDALPNLAPGAWAALLPLALLLILLQTGAEEVLFRGYLMQQLAARFRSPLVWLVAPALLFGAVHYDPGTAGTNSLLVVASATLFGLLAGDLTRRTGTIGAAWGFHFANNALALLVVATDGTLTGLALYVTPYGVADPVAFAATLPLDLAVMVAGYGAIRWLLER